MRFPVTKEGFNLIKLFTGLSAGFYVLTYWSKLFLLLSASSLIITLFLCYFFRDPERVCLQEERVVLSPADGKVIDITEEDYTELIQGPAWVIKIFMSVFNVHVQRAPLEGMVRSTAYRKGTFLPAMKEEADRKNEQNIITIQTSSTGTETRGLQPVYVAVKQIAGILARRIVCWCKEGDQLNRGQRIGMIMFGSQVDMFLPKKVTLRIEKGDRVVAGVTVVGEWNEGESREQTG